ncbi:MAG: DegV family protein [Anaerorhabdus sp.]
MKKLAVLVDSAADISNEEAKQIGIHVIRMPLIVDDVAKLECDEISDQEFFDKMKAGAKVKTSQPILGDLIKKWDELLKDYEQILYIPISEGLSGTYSSAQIASKEYNNRVVVVRSLLVAYPIQEMAREALVMADKGISTEEIKDILENQSGMYAVIVPETLVYLKNGGRISPAAATLGSLLKIVPLLKLEDGKIDALDKVRTIKKAYQKSAEYVSAIENKEDYIWYIVHSDCEDRAQEFKESIQSLIGQEVHIRPLRSIITAHTGPGTLAIGRVKKLKY